jgi:ankyrin repeat protein
LESLFDPNKPYFTAWLQLHDMDVPSPGSTKSGGHPFTPISKSYATPLYYAALCGFQDLAEHLTVNNPEHVTATGGYLVTPLIAAMDAGHYRTAKFLRDNGAHPNVTGYRGRSPLLGAAWLGNVEMVQVLLEYKADVNARSDIDETPLHFTIPAYSMRPHVGPSSMPKVARLLLEHGVDVNARRDDRCTALHIATRNGMVEVVRVLLEHGADVGAEDKHGETAFQLARFAGEEEGTEIKKLLSEHGAR